MSQGFDTQTAKFLAMAATCMPGLTRERMGHFISNPKELRRKLFGLLPDFVQPPIWATVEVGRHHSGTGIDGGYFCGDSAFYDAQGTLREMLLAEVVPLETTRREVDLLLVSVAELGFAEDAHRGDVDERAFSLGLKAPPVEVAFDIGRDHAELVRAIQSGWEFQLTIPTTFSPTPRKGPYRIIIDCKLLPTVIVALEPFTLHRKMGLGAHLVYEKPRS